MSRTRRKSWRTDWARWFPEDHEGETVKYQTRDGCGKSPGYEFWSRRPMKGGMGKVYKVLCHRIERARARQALRRRYEEELNAMEDAAREDRERLESDMDELFDLFLNDLFFDDWMT